MGLPFINTYILFTELPRALWICTVVHLTHLSTVNPPAPPSPHIRESECKKPCDDAFMEAKMGDSWVLEPGPICLLSWMCNGPSWCGVLSSSPKPSLLLLAHAQPFSISTQAETASPCLSRQMIRDWRRVNKTHRLCATIRHARLKLCQPLLPMPFSPWGPQGYLFISFLSRQLAMLRNSRDCDNLISGKSIIEVSLSEWRHHAWAPWCKSGKSNRYNFICGSRLRLSLSASLDFH